VSALSVAALALGACGVLVHVPLLVAPAAARRWVAAFPRSRAPAWVLTGVALVWAAVVTYQTPMGMIERFKPWLYVITPVSFLLIVTLMDELLAPRALGGWLLLAPAPVLVAARASDSPARLAMVVLAYVLAVAGIALVLSPYRFRRTAELLLRSEASCRAWGAVGIGVGVAILSLGVAAY
jgi:uncharacterized protein YjeT (DUF2065 family)